MKHNYNKLVRNEVINKILEDGLACSYTELTDDTDYIYALEDKLQEEVAEYMEVSSLEELADVLEVVYCIAQARGWSLADLENERAAKENQLGAFDKKIFLNWVSN